MVGSKSLAPWSVYLQALPNAMHTVANAAWMHSQQNNQGNVHCKNACTINSQAMHFASWLGKVGYYDDQTVQLIGPAEGTMLLEGYLHVILTNASSCFLLLQIHPTRFHFAPLSQGGFIVVTHWAGGYHTHCLSPLIKSFSFLQFNCVSFQVGFPTRQVQTLYSPNALHILSSSLWSSLSRFCTTSIMFCCCPSM